LAYGYGLNNGGCGFNNKYDSVMIVIGVCGGIASGKSLVAAELERLGAVWINADRLGHEVLAESEVKRLIRDRWGSVVFNSDGSVNRAAVAKIVFAAPPAGPVELQHLEKLTHPRIGEKLRERIEQLRQQAASAVVLDAPVMFRAGWNRLCDRLLFVDAPRQLRLERARSRGWTEEEFDAREAAQESLTWKQQQSDCVIDNSHTPAHTAHQVQQFWDSLSHDFPS
ncbi:MAG: dephospho-CoA kinase, partial [Planctomycetales bacterium]|nr:dephospho-CoA kinase [Planctomycetales bacterium]